MSVAPASTRWLATGARQQQTHTLRHRWMRTFNQFLLSHSHLPYSTTTTHHLSEVSTHHTHPSPHISHSLTPSREAQHTMSVNITVAVPLDIIAAIKQGSNSCQTADARATIVKSVIDTIKALPYDIKPVNTTTTTANPENTDDNASIASFDSEASASAPRRSKVSIHKLAKAIRDDARQIRVSVKTVTGKTVSLMVSPNDTTYDVKTMVHEVEGIPPDVQSLIFEGQQLKEGRHLAEVCVLLHCRSLKRTLTFLPVRRCQWRNHLARHYLARELNSEGVEEGTRQQQR